MRSTLKDYVHVRSLYDRSGQNNPDHLPMMCQNTKEHASFHRPAVVVYYVFVVENFCDLCSKHFFSDALLKGVV